MIKEEKKRAETKRELKNLLTKFLGPEDRKKFAVKKPKQNNYIEEMQQINREFLSMDLGQKLVKHD